MSKVDTSLKKFAERWLENGQNATEAYLFIKPTAGYNTARTEGGKYLAKPDTQSIITEIQSQDSQKSEITRESLLKDYQFIKDRNLANENDKIAVLAMQEQAKLLGLNAPARIESTNTNTNFNGDLTPDEEADLARATEEAKVPQV